MIDFPDFCIRGVRTSNITPDGELSAMVFYPDERTIQNRLDGGMEKSINWEDDAIVIGFTLQQFPTGVVRLARVELDKINSLPKVCNELAYERSPLLNNKYHGNIVYHKNLTKPRIRLIAASLTLVCSDLIKK